MSHALTLNCPFPTRLHPEVDQLNQMTLEWAIGHGLTGNLRKQTASERFTWLVAGFYPEGARARLQLLSDWTSWLFWHDDVCDETDIGNNPARLKRVFDRLFYVLEGGDPSNNMYELSLAELSRRFQTLSPDTAWWHRFLTSTREYFDACLWESDNRQARQVPSVGDYIAMRRCAGGMWIYVDFVEFVAGKSLPLLQRQNQTLRQLAQVTTNIACWHNDLFSFAKEDERGDVHNLVTVLRVEQQLEVGEAFHLAVDYVNREVERYLRLRGELRIPELGPYLEGLQALMRGNLDWSLSSGRYVSQGELPILCAA